MKTFALVKGDLSPAPGGYLMFEGAAKIHQDLALALQEAYGGDALHPRWGSILQSMIGEPLTPSLRQAILTEVNRVLSNYIAVQNARIIQDSNNHSLSALTTDDVVASVTNTTAQQVYDSIVISVGLQTVSRQSIQINQVIQ